MSSLTPSTQNTPASVREQLSLVEARQQLEGQTGRRFWRSLDELSRKESFGDLLQQEFPRFSAEWDPMHRRTFLRLMGASLALGGLTACTRQPREKIIPYVKQPENMIPGKAQFYATTATICGYGFGLLATSHMGRPTKVDGNELHPASLGGTDAALQASILTMYDPDRSQSPRRKGGATAATWETFDAELQAQLEQQTAAKGAGLRILSGPVSSPTFLALMKEVTTRFPSAVWHTYEPVSRSGWYEATVAAFGQKLDPVYNLADADVIVSFDADFLSLGPAHVRMARDFGSRRSVEAGSMNRLYVAESQMSTTGAAADHRLALTPDAIESVARAVAHALGVAVTGSHDTPHAAWAEALAADLKAHAGRSVVLAGEHRSPALQALALAINAQLGNLGKTVTLIKPVTATGASLADLAQAIDAGSVQALLMFDVNPAYDAPADLALAERLAKVPFTVQHGLFDDETGALSTWHVPASHYLEYWGDARAFDGTTSLVQPLIEPLYKTRSELELLAAVAGRPGTSGYDLVRATWLDTLGGDLAFKRALHDGLLADTTEAAVSVSLAWKDAGPGETPTTPDQLDLAILPDYAVADGRLANNGWMQEMPRPITTLTWDNALLISEDTAGRLGLATGDLVELDSGNGKVTAPVLVAVGIPVGAGVVHMGYGRTAAGRVGNGVGFAVSPLQTAASPHRASVRVRKTGDGFEFALTQESHTIAGRNHLRVGTVSDFKADKKFVMKFGEFGGKETPSIFPPHDYSQGPQWGMVIDLSACIGCNACMIACQAENNIPVVGKDQVRRGREMHWIRVDRYYEGRAADAAVHHQPMTCVQCENAPCEAVCPVAATVHSTDGINQMVYNRCVGTRYCSNNCPYKVRRFNFYKFADHETPSLKLQRNPNVTVRARGVMEKCTFCIQRISEARIKARREDRAIADGEVVTACQQACPTRAIVFGDIRDPMSEVSKRKESPLNYGVLAVLNTRPRLTYHARIRNPNTSLETSSPMESSHHGA
ncbi:MAG TPA: TAT-variant-translocated molybdopterin oxidoreductase [Kiritimatiellia bacterium]|nr:TAT-variant-translocated molybdopterin oxidoreductase [Kiritimatiellia bacterium]HMP35079.1 TAT-variant-translocated molybdopterin oxidoreductase [Kiritimatiellia bacterium]